MPNRKKKGKKGKSQSGNPWGSVRLGSFRAEFPMPRIPRLLGAATSLPAGLSLYPNVKLDVPIIPLAQNVTSGALLSSNPIDLTAVQGFATRFATLFNEYAIVGANLEVRITDVTNPAGLVICFIDEESSTSPTIAQALNRARLDMLINQMTTPRPYRIQWSPRDILDLDFVSTATTFTPAWLKLASGATTGTTGTTSCQVLITGALSFVFRGYS